jgi:hypothetical protein
MKPKNKANLLFAAEKILLATGCFIALFPGCLSLATVPYLIGRKLEIKRTMPRGLGIKSRSIHAKKIFRNLRRVRSLATYRKQINHRF